MKDYAVLTNDGKYTIFELITKEFVLSLLINWRDIRK